ncbi:hypothetical protein IAU59_002141 [Kwoniella sp. CBS 9459]
MPAATNDPHAISDDFKEDIQHVEDPEAGIEKKNERDVEYDAQDGGDENRKGLRRLLRRNPSYEFIREVAVADTEPLDKPQVKRLERRLWLMIVPALCIDYIFYYVDKT